MSENLKPQRKSTDQDVLNSLGNKEVIGEGADSVVYRVANGERGVNHVLKKYRHKPFTSKPPSEQRRVLERYYDYTEQISEFINSNKNPLNQSIEVKEGDKAVLYDLEYQLIPQGSIILKAGSFRSSFGQPFVSGMNLYERMGKSINEKFLSNLDHLIRNFFGFLEKKFKFNFHYSSRNVKFDINQEEKKVTVKITDLASSITDMKSGIISSE